MAKAFFIRDTHLARLKKNVAVNAPRYRSGKPWLAEYFGGDGYYMQARVDIPDDLQLMLPVQGSKTELSDLENTQILYSSLRHLTPVQASDERLWAYLTHVTFWDYMRKRWPVEQYEAKPDKLPENMSSRYMFGSDRPRSLVRNGIARLWWYGFTTYDEHRADPFELTAVLLRNLDVAQTLLERAFSRNKAVTRAFLSALLEWEKSGEPFPRRDEVRELAKHVTHVGGVTIIDALTFDQLRQLVRLKVEALGVAA
jgi:hypothetical protein